MKDIVQFFMVLSSYFTCSALASVKDSSVPTIVLPEVSSTTLMQLEASFLSDTLAFVT